VNTSQLLSKHITQVYFGGNWTEVSLKETLTPISFEMALTKVDGFNTVLALTFHIHYFVRGVIPVFQGKALDISDKFSFDHHEIKNEAE
jgi:uncharacterized damage-inducible protein DinB